jgi:hypothetical protein
MSSENIQNVAYDNSSSRNAFLLRLTVSRTSSVSTCCLKLRRESAERGSGAFKTQDLKEIYEHCFLLLLILREQT